MVEFKEINGQLCKMLEKPIPLTEDAKFPCAVRLIQDDSPMGRLNRRHRDTNIKQDIKYICVSVKNYVMQTETDSIMAIEAYEILGYPVADGSAEWALWQMQQGKGVAYKKAVGDVCWALNDNKNVQYYDMKNLDYIGPIREQDKFLKWFKVLMPTGWQLYVPKSVPKHLLADAKVGDLCQRRDGKYVLIESISYNRPCPIMCKSDIGGMDCFGWDGRNHNTLAGEKDIVSTEPLAAEGTSEWALQMMKLGKKVQHESYSMPSTHCAIYDKHTVVMFITPAFYTVIGNPVCHINDWLRSRQIDSLIDERIGWQLYEQKPGPKPAEVRVKVQLEGTVRSGSNESCFEIATPNGGWATIGFNEIDSATAALVRELIKKQEER